MYSYIIHGDESAKHLRAKGVAKSSLNLISHQNYIDCLFNPDDPMLARQPITMKSIRSKKHTLTSTVSEKFGLSCNDTKRYVIPDGPGKLIETLAFGHYAIPKFEDKEDKKEKEIKSPSPPIEQPKQKKGRPIKYKV